VAVVGCGGAGRGAAVGLLHAGVRPVLVNRGPTRGRWAAGLLRLPYLPLDRFDPADFGLVVHATPVRDHCAFRVERMDPGAALVDLAYGTAETALVTAARRRGLSIVDGWDILAAEAARQFRLLTRRVMPPGIVDDLRAHAWGLR
jgi:shikimate 5-dehydrogenase